MAVNQMEQNSFTVIIALFEIAVWKKAWRIALHVRTISAKRYPDSLNWHRKQGMHSHSYEHKKCEPVAEPDRRERRPPPGELSVGRGGNQFDRSSNVD